MSSAEQFSFRRASRLLDTSMSVDEDGLAGMTAEEAGRYDGRLGSKWSFLKTLKEKKAEEKENPAAVVNIIYSELVSLFTIWERK